ncbi:MULTISPECIES: hypothetical protein [Granulicatella]|mgnify:FL=1|uniref:hypothetical protein n=1 Tax=Granulicatella TaxID=117563 RepID=UPI00066D3D63|nr:MULTISPECIES: hypothetical protein [unclassified Granulicatella]
MELEQAKQKKQQLEEELAKKIEDLNALKKERGSLEADLNVKKENISTAEQVIFDRREDLRKLEIAIEVMER